MRSKSQGLSGRTESRSAERSNGGTPRHGDGNTVSAADAGGVHPSVDVDTSGKAQEQATPIGSESSDSPAQPLTRQQRWKLKNKAKLAEYMRKWRATKRAPSAKPTPKI